MNRRKLKKAYKDLSFAYDAPTDMFDVYAPNKAADFLRRHPNIIKEYVTKELNLKNFEELYNYKGE